MNATDTISLVASIVVGLLGLTSLVGGLYTFLHAKYLQRHCTAEAKGTIVALLDEGFKKKRAPTRKTDDDVVAANEQIAAKKRAYNAKKRSEAQAAADATLSTWRPLVSYTVDGRTYEVKAARGVTQNQFKVGQATQVHYSPGNPGRTHWFQIDGLPTGMGVTLMVCGAVLIGIGAACWFVLPELGLMSAEVFMPPTE